MLEPLNPYTNRYEFEWEVYKNTPTGSLIFVFFAIPLLALLTVLDPAVYENFRGYLFGFLIFYIPYTLYSVISTKFAEKQLKSIYQRKYDQGILVLRANFIFHGSFFFLLLQVLSFIGLKEGFHLGPEGTLIAVVCFLFIDGIQALVVILSPGRWLDPPNFNSKIDWDRLTKLAMLPWFVIVFGLPFLLSTIGPYDHDMLFVFFLLAPLVFIFYIFFINAYEFPTMVRWRKETFWEKDPDALRPAEELAELDARGLGRLEYK